MLECFKLKCLKQLFLQTKVFLANILKQFSLDDVFKSAPKSLQEINLNNSNIDMGGLTSLLPNILGPHAMYRHFNSFKFIIVLGHFH